MFASSCRHLWNGCLRPRRSALLPEMVLWGLDLKDPSYWTFPSCDAIEHSHWVKCVP